MKKPLPKVLPFKSLLVSLFLLLITNLAYSQNTKDSIVRFEDLRFHSTFEQTALTNYVKHQKDTFNLFLAIDENMTAEEADMLFTKYSQLYDEFDQKKISEKKINTKIKLGYSIVHSKFLDKYNSNEYFPVMLRSGTYNCVSASMLYAMVFDKLAIPYKVKVSSNHVYLIANPGSNSTVIETTNPSFEKAVFTGEFKQQYVTYLRSSKLISDDEYKNKSVEEIFEENYNQVRDAEFNNLAGFQYYNKALATLQDNKIDNGLMLAQKAYFFYPDQQVKTLLYTALLVEIEKSSFEKVQDIDYLAQFSRFEDNDMSDIVLIFNNIINNFLQYTNKENYCDSLYQRFIAKISDKKLSEEIRFGYNMQMSYRYANSDNVEKYISKAIMIKGNHHDACIIMENCLRKKLFAISNSMVLLDTIAKLEKRYENITCAESILKEHQLKAYLNLANQMYDKNKIADGDLYLSKFESNCQAPVSNEYLRPWIESTYRAISAYYRDKGNKTKANRYTTTGLVYVPDSRLLKSGY